MVQRTRGSGRTGCLRGQNATRGSDLSGARRGTAMHGAGPVSQPAGDQGDGSDAGPAHNRLRPSHAAHSFILGQVEGCPELAKGPVSDRKSTRLNSSHANISYAVFCLKKKNIT